MKYNFNLLGAYTLYIKEVRRFLKVYHQTIIAPSISALLYLSIFVLAMGDIKSEIHGVAFMTFIGTGLIAMTMVQNAFANTSSSLIMSKVIGYIIDIIMPPLGALEIIISYALGGITRGLMNGVLVALLLSFFIDFKVYHLGSLIFFSFSSCLLLSLIGIFAGIAANSFDQSAAITSYLITPLSFLSGTFYSAEKLPAFFKMVNNFNPFFYMIDGFRYSLTNYADSNIEYGMIYITTVNIVIMIIIHRLLSTGWRIKN